MVSPMWTCAAVSMLWMTLAGRAVWADTSDLTEHTAADFYEKLHSGRMMFFYFEHHVSPPVALFLAELAKSGEALQDYGVLVGKVNCNTEEVQTYCGDQRLVRTAFLFRGGKEFLSFDLDTVFDVNSIVSEVLFAILREEVKYVHTDADLLAMEKAARGRRDMVLGYVRSLGTAEHRSMMETAYVYGSKYQFILITGGPVLKHFQVDESSPPSSSRAWFLHCGGPATKERCPLTPMRRPLSTLSLHAFLRLMEAPLLSEVYDDPSSVPPPPPPYQLTPQVFLFSRPETERLDRDAAAALARRLRGVALLLLVHRQSPAVKTPEHFNAAYRLPEKSSEVKYLTLHSPDELLDLFTRQEEDEEEEQEEEDEEEEDFGKLDDEIAASVFERRGETPDSDSVTHLTSHSFHAAVARSGLTVALFYLTWDAVSLAVLSSFVEAADSLAALEVDGVQMSLIDCGEWTDLCAARPGAAAAAVPFRPVTAFPTVLLLRPRRAARRYRGMLGSEPLQRFVLMSREASPSLLSSAHELTRFLQSAPHPGVGGHGVDRVVGLFPAGSPTGVSVFTDVAESLSGEALSGLLTGAAAETWAAERRLELPAVLVFPWWRTLAPPLRLTPPSSAEELLALVRSALLHPLPELTVESLPAFLAPGKALLLLFVGEEEDEAGRRQTRALLEEMSGAVELGGQRMEPYLPCWIHLGRTPAGMAVLGSYLGYMPPLPALVLTHLSSGDEVYRYPPEDLIEASSILRWVQRIEEGAEPPAGMLGDDRWPPSAPFYDFLRAMDAEQAGSRQEGTSEEEEEEEVDVEEHLTPEEMRKYKPKKNLKPHSEL